MDKNFQMTQRNTANTDWDFLYPVTKSSNIINELSTICTNKDANDIYTTVTFNRKDTKKYMTSVLSGGTSPNYTTRTETYYASDGITIVTTKIYTRTYDVNDKLISEVLN